MPRPTRSRHRNQTRSKPKRRSRKKPTRKMRDSEEEYRFERNEERREERDKDETNNADKEELTEETYVVEAIRKHRKSMKKKYPKTRPDGTRCCEYYVKWFDWSEDSNTWEHEDTLSKCKKVIDAYWKQINETKEEKKRKSSKHRNEVDEKKRNKILSNHKNGPSPDDEQKPIDEMQESQHEVNVVEDASSNQDEAEPHDEDNDQVNDGEFDLNLSMNMNYIVYGNKKPQSVAQKKKTIRKRNIRPNRIVIPFSDSEANQEESEQRELQPNGRENHGNDSKDKKEEVEIKCMHEEQEQQHEDELVDIDENRRNHQKKPRKRSRTLHRKQPAKRQKIM